MRWLDCITDSMDMNLSKLQGTVEEPGVLQSIGSQKVRHNLGTKQEQSWASLFPLGSFYPLQCKSWNWIGPDAPSNFRTSLISDEDHFF